MEEVVVASAVGRELQVDAGAAGGGSAYGYAVWVTAELLSLVLYLPINKKRRWEKGGGGGGKQQARLTK